MAAFKGYFDESGKEDDPQFADSGIAVAGYVTTVDSWLEIEAKWQAVLSRPEFNVPYLHMKEFAHSKRGSPFESWRGNEPRRRDFIAALAQVIRASDLFGTGAIIRLPDLWQFNRDYGCCLEAYPLGIYACLIELSREWPESTIEAVWDHVDKPETQIASARAYARSDRWYAKCGKGVKITPLGGFVEGSNPSVERSSKNIPSLQVADFAAYELLKSHRDKNDWFKNEMPFVRPEDWFKSQFTWTLNKATERGRNTAWPDQRKSYLALFSSEDAPRMEGAIWTYRTLVRSHLMRRGVWA